MRGFGWIAAAVLMLAPGFGPAVAQQARRAPAVNWVNTITRTPEGGYRQGNPNAPVKLVEYGSRTCPTCGRFGTEGVGPLRAEFIASGKVSYEYRDFLIHGAPDFALALLNQCVATPAFFRTLDAIYANQPAFAARLQAVEKSSATLLDGYQKLPPAQMAAKFAETLGYLDFMAKRGLPVAQARRCLADPVRIKSIAKVNADAVNVYGVDSTPSFFVNGRKVRAYTWDALQPELRAAGA
jgi:protein-disulfide isomerase